MDKKAPLGTKILAVLMGLRGLMGIQIAVIALTAEELPAVLEEMLLGSLISLQNVFTVSILSIIYLIGAVLVFKVNKYGWWALTVLATVEAISSLISLLIGLYYGVPLIVEFVITVVMGLIFWYLLRSKTREAFGIKLFSKRRSNVGNNKSELHWFWRYTTRWWFFPFLLPYSFVIGVYS